MTTIGASLVITGEVTSKEDITVHGQIKGQISMAQGSLLVAPTARIEADVNVTNVTIHGNMSGKVAAGERVELTPTATMKGTLIAPAVILCDGATFNGNIQVDKKGGAATRPAAKVN
jgi:cytoskeletal protein CcmA (bactofilin family)